MRLLIFASFCCFLLKTAYGCVDDAACGANGMCVDSVCLCDPGYFTSVTQCDGDCTTYQSSDCDALFEVCTSASTCSSDCVALDCQNGGTCKNTDEVISSQKCHCTAAYTGTSCGCLLANYDSATQTCWCSSGFTGVDCLTPCDASCTDGCIATAIDCIVPAMCPLSPCQGGTCTSYEGATTAECRCNAGVTGEYCDKCVDATGCNASNGTCTTGDCTCKAGYAGQFCQHACEPDCVTCNMKEDGSGAECSGAVRVLASLVLTLAAVLRAAF